MTRNKFNIHQEKNAIVNHAVDKIIFQENNKIIAQYEAHENIESEIDENDLYQIDNMSLEKKKKIQNGVSVRLKANLKIHMRLKSRMV